MRVRAWLYQQFDADLSRDVPGEGFGGWRSEVIDVPAERTAVVLMHAWDTGTSQEYPGWYRSVEYLGRANAIARDVLPGLLKAIRGSGVRLIHVVGGGDYYRDLPGYHRAVELAGPEPPALPRIASDPSLERLQALREDKIFVGAHNRVDVERGFARLDFMPQARPAAGEGIAENGHQLHALCRETGVNHLVYAGFAINWCLLVSPGGMVDMGRRGFLCSALREAVTAVENRETARSETAKQLALWRVALGFGFVFDVPDFVASLNGGIR